MKLRISLCTGLLLCSFIASPSFVSATDRQTGSVTNNCNGEVYLTFISRTGEENSKVVMPSQSIPVPEDTVEVKAELMNDVYGDETTSVGITMPDGSAHMLQSLPGSVRISEQN